MRLQIDLISFSLRKAKLKHGWTIYGTLMEAYCLTTPVNTGWEEAIQTMYHIGSDPNPDSIYE
jgi:hypothetical protein